MTGLCVSILPVLIAVLSFFPVWIGRGGAHVVSGFAVLLCVLAFSPLFKSLREALKSPASYVLWFAAFLLFFMLSKVADEMTVISFVGFVSNLIGALFFKLAEKYSEKKEEK